MSVYETKKSRFWQYDFQFKGVRFHGSTGIKKGEARRSAAQRIEDRVRERAARGEINPRKPMTLNEAAGRYYDEVGRHTRSAKTIDYQLEYLVAGLGRTALLHEIDTGAVAAYVGRRRVEKTRRKRFPTAASINRELELLGRVLGRARRVWKAEMGDEISWRDVKLAEPRERVRELTADEETRLFAVLRPDYHAIVIYAFRTGVRLENAVALRWDEIDIVGMVTRFTGKGGKELIVPLTPDILALFRDHCPKTHAQVFTFVAEKNWTEPGTKRAYRKGERYPVTRGGLRRVWSAALKNAGIADFRWHDLRHTAGTRTLRRSGNLKAVQKMLGHEDISTTAKYAHAMIDDVRAAMMLTEAESRNSPGAESRETQKPKRAKQDG